MQLDLGHRSIRSRQDFFQESERAGVRIFYVYSATKHPFCATALAPSFQLARHTPFALQVERFDQRALLKVIWHSLGTPTKMLTQAL
eukprot:scaffold714_cov121-Isochrysis_galbana.AAC.13